MPLVDHLAGPDQRRFPQDDGVRYIYDFWKALQWLQKPAPMQGIYTQDDDQDARENERKMHHRSFQLRLRALYKLLRDKDCPWQGANDGYSKLCANPTYYLIHVGFQRSL